MKANIKSKDVMKQELHDSFSAALSSDDENALPDLLTSTAMQFYDDFMADVTNYQQTQDTAILEKRGVHTLTANETKFYNALKSSYDKPDIKSALDAAGLTPAFPQTVIDSVMDDVTTQFPLLSAINFQNTSTLTKILINKEPAQLATWGALGSKVTAELSGTIGKIDLGTNKLTAFMIISRDMLDAGPQWIDAYVRAVLTEAIGGALCKAIIAGNGKDQPIGMLKDLSAAVDPTNGYADKTAAKITDLGVATMSGIALELSKTDSKRTRPVPEILMVVSPADYFSKVLPATTLMTPTGGFANNVIPYPTRIVQDSNVPSGKAVFGLANRYFMGIGKGGSGGTIEYSDEFNFLDDTRTYKTKFYGNGQPLDNNAFVVKDISGLKENILKVQMVSEAAPSGT